MAVGVYLALAVAPPVLRSRGSLEGFSFEPSWSCPCVFSAVSASVSLRLSVYLCVQLSACVLHVQMRASTGSPADGAARPPPLALASCVAWAELRLITRDVYGGNRIE